MRHRQAGDTAVITLEMIEAGFQVLCNSGIADSYLRADKTLVSEIFLAMCDASPENLHEVEHVP